MKAANEMTLAELLANRTEVVFQGHVIRSARGVGWDLVYHTKLSIGSAKGFPDLVLVRFRDKRVVYMELKGLKTAIGPEQQRWIDGLVACGQEAYIFRPCDEERVQEVLR